MSLMSFLTKIPKPEIIERKLAQLMPNTKRIKCEVLPVNNKVYQEEKEKLYEIKQNLA